MWYTKRVCVQTVGTAGDILKLYYRSANPRRFLKVQKANNA